jgi:hypothetical protein
MIVVTVDTLVDLVIVVTVVFTDGGLGCGVVEDDDVVASVGASVVASVSVYVGSSVGKGGRYVV